MDKINWKIISKTNGSENVGVRDSYLFLFRLKFLRNSHRSVCRLRGWSVIIKSIREPPWNTWRARENRYNTFREERHDHNRIGLGITNQNYAALFLSFKQVAATNAVKSWCMSKIQDLEVRTPAETQYYKLLRSPSVDQSLVDSDPECLPLLSLISEESSSSLATYVNVLPSPGAGPNNDGKSLEFGEARGRRFFEMKLNGSSGLKKMHWIIFISIVTVTVKIPKHP